jgi:serine/threonine protein kinase/Tol biopolymer transport system component
VTPERYQRINQVADAALAQTAEDRAGFLDEACKGDPELRGSVEALLAAHESHESGDDLLATPVFETLAKDVASEWEKRDGLPGNFIGHYEILRRLGAGGIGEVWLARDTQLRREVALKLLNPAFGNDPEQVLRLQQEARAASRLNHPNIVTIYEIGEASGTHFIAQEFVAGDTLRRAIAEKKIQPKDALKIADQVAAALDAANEAQIVHRDVKPENVMIRPDGLVKLVDFGLAAPREAGSKSRVVMGTARYMSPEQAQGADVDARSDLFSLGVMLHEMLTGTAPFTGATISETLTAIVKSDPPPLPESLPDRAAVERIVRKCLQKKPEARYTSAAELRVDLARAIARMENRWSVRKKRLVGVGIIAAIAAAAVTYWTSVDKQRDAAPFTSMTITRLTTRGEVADAAIAPDGASIVYVLDEGDRQGLWIRQLASGRDAEILAPEANEHRGLIFSRDGDSIYYIRRDAEGSDVLYRIGARGGKPELILGDVGSPVAFSADGKQFAFVRLGRFRSDASLMVANADGTGARTVATRHTPRYFSRSGLAWSPDGKTIICLGGQARFYTADAFQILGVRVADGLESEIGSRAWPWVGSMAWSRNGVLLVAGESSEDLQQVWQISYPRGEVRRITNDLTDYSSVSTTADGSALVSVQKETPVDLWLMTPGESARATRISRGDLRGVNSIGWMPDQRIVYDARAGEYRNIWITDAEGRNPQQVTNGAPNKSEIAVTRDGRFILYQAEGKIWRINSDGSGARQLTHGALDVHPWPTADGREVIYASFQDWSPVIGGRPELWKVPIDGGEASKLTSDAFSLPHVSPDGKRIAALYFPAADPRFSPKKGAVIPIDGGSPIAVFDLLPGGSGTAYWTPDGKALVSGVTTGAVGNLWLQSLDGGRPYPITDFKSDLILDFAWSADGRRIVLARGKSSSDVVLIRNFR